ncbi:MAG: RnfABCDGE type electron transport complex subunit D [Clostridia bacterium]|nr:RnfABCDGE type electron transport complex subunit D [Clostridia bacterium]
MNKLLVTPSPHITKQSSTNIMMFAMIFALIPTAMYGLVVFGVRALLIIGISVGSAYLFEVLFNLLKYRKVEWLDFSSIVTGFMLALVLPVNVPFYVPIIGSFIAIVIFKGCFGGIGKNLFNPTAAARVVLGFIFTGLTLAMFTGTALGENVASPLAYFAKGDFSAITIRSLFFGNVAGAIGTVSIICILVAGIILMAFKITDYIIPVGSIITFIAVIWAMLGATAILPYLFSGSFLFVTMFMLPEPTTSPNTVWGKFCFGLMFGAIAALFRVFNILGETSVFMAVLIMNILAPLLDKIFAPRPIGVKRGA